MMNDPNCIIGIGYAQPETRPSVTLKAVAPKSGIAVR